MLYINCVVLTSHVEHVGYCVELTSHQVSMTICSSDITHFES